MRSRDSSLIGGIRALREMALHWSTCVSGAKINNASLLPIVSFSFWNFRPPALLEITGKETSQKQMAKQQSNFASRCHLFDAVFHRVCFDEPILAVACTCCNPNRMAWKWSTYSPRIIKFRHSLCILQSLGCSKDRIIKICNWRKRLLQSGWQGVQESSHFVIEPQPRKA